MQTVGYTVKNARLYWIHDTAFARLTARKRNGRREKMTEWIPVSDRLPEPFKSVLITFEHTQYATRIPHRVVTVGIGFYNGKKWSQAISALQSYKDTKVLAWMPLPDIWEES